MAYSSMLAFRMLAWLVAYHRAVAPIDSSSVLDDHHTRQHVVIV